MHLPTFTMLLVLIPVLGLAQDVHTEWSGHKASLTMSGSIGRASVPREGYIFVSFPVPDGTEVKDGEIFENIPCEISVGMFALNDAFYAKEEKTYKQNPSYKVVEQKSPTGRVYVMKRVEGNGTDDRRRQYIERGDIVYVVDVSWITMRGYPAKTKSAIEKEFLAVLKTITLDGTKWDGAGSIKLRR